jgi:microcystin-dependent protein
MALESATYIDDLNTANPAPTDLIGQGDDHIRLIKAVLKATFPNITGPMTATQADLNSIAAAISASGVPVGVITAWYGSSASVPSGWHICDGTAAVPRSDASGTIAVPDLRNLVIMGAGTVAAQGAAFGAANQSATTAAAGAHSHATTAGGGGHIHAGVTVAGHALTTSEIPAHTHTVACGTSEGDTSTNFTNGGNSAGSAVTTSSVGGGAAHTHGMAWPTTPDGVHTHTTDAAAAHTHGVTLSVYQPAKALHYIMKV